MPGAPRSRGDRELYGAQSRESLRLGIVPDEGLHLFTLGREAEIATSGRG